MIKFILIGGFISLVLVVIFALLKIASDFNEETEEFYDNFYEDDCINEEFDYYCSPYKEIIDEQEDRKI